jgi:hypothetical protein
MTISKEQIESLGLAEREPGGSVYCPKCDRGLKFNSGQPAVFHAEDCERYAEGQTYVGEGQTFANTDLDDSTGQGSFEVDLLMDWAFYAFDRS